MANSCVRQREDDGTNPGDIFICVSESSVNGDTWAEAQKADWKRTGINTEKAVADYQCVMTDEKRCN